MAPYIVARFLNLWQLNEDFALPRYTKCRIDHFPQIWQFLSRLVTAKKCCCCCAASRRILVDYMSKTDPDWLLANVLKVIDVTAKENPHPGKLLAD